MGKGFRPLSGVGQELKRLAGTPAVCNQGLCTRKARKDDVFCNRHRRLLSRSYPEGMRVVFAPSPVSQSVYSECPLYESHGTVVKMPLPGGRSTFLKGPAGGLLYVLWDSGSYRGLPGRYHCGVSPLDCYREGK